MTVRPRRSALFMPASNPRAIAKARALDCDVVILDLEDAVAPAAKWDARDAALAAVRDGGFGRRELVVRVNGFDTEWGEDDCRALADARPDTVLLPKVDDAATVARARAILGKDVPIWAMIESAAAVLRVEALCGGAKAYGLELLVVGPNDLAREMRCVPGEDRTPLLPALTQIVLSARAHGLGVLDGVCNAIDDPARVERECRQGLAWGFDGKTLIHPSQIAPANAVFTPGAEHVAEAEALVAAFEAPEAAGRGAIRVNGRMVERLHLEEARRVLAIAAAVELG